MASSVEQLAEPRRLRQLQMRRILDTPREEAFDRLTRLAAHATSAPVALLTFVDDHRQWFKSAYGLGEPWATRRETPLSHSFCQYVVTRCKPLIVNDARRNPLVANNLAISEIGVEAYLGAPIVDSDGIVLGSFAVVNDRPRIWTPREVAILEDFARLTMLELELRTEIELRSRAEESLRQSQKLEAIGRLAGGVAHDFNNMLLIINGYTKLLREETPPGDARSSYIAEIGKAAERASALTRQLLAFSRKQVLQAKRIDLNAIVTDLHPMLARAVGEAIELKLRLAPDLYPVNADPTQMEQVILNLVLNARDATTPPGTIELRTSNRPARKNGEQDESRESGLRDCAELQIVDFGSGIAADALEHLFEPFYTTKGAGRGTGLGLATVYGIVRQSDGRIWAESLPGKGSVFHVSLPRAMDSAPERQEADVTRPAQFRGATILVVEDEDGVRKLITTVLERAGYRVLSASGAQQARRIVSEASRPIDLAILDVVIPESSGRQLSEQLARLQPRMRIAFMSGYTDDEVLRHGIEHGTVRFIDKPVAPDRLLSIVAETLNSEVPRP